ncbi:MAG: DUF3054 domain-containing protein [Nigerium sp.]|nr:DUF3054 domain-containing protein [Nigerium sp.]
MNRSVAILLDLVLVVAFAVIGRASHGESLDYEGIQRTALPFVAGLLIAWIGFLLKRHTGITVTNGVFAWAMTVAIGILFRLLLGSTAELGFIIVTALFLAATLIGWRAIWWLVVRNRPQQPKPKDPRRSGNPARRAAGQE